MHPLQPGDPSVIGPYVLIARLGSGGMGHVFLGRTRGGRTVAVKAVRPELASDPEFRRRFRREVVAARAVSGRFTASVVDADPDAAVPWLATSYVSGLSLREVVADGWVLPEASVAVLAGGLARALAEIHAAGVVHRDLKPSNVMLAVDGPRVIDFGISRVLSDSLDMTRVEAGTIVGSPGFMSPEQARGLELTGATDVFSLGTVLAFAATGRNPFGGGPDQALLYRIAHDEPDLDGVPESLVPLITACLAKEPADRPTPQQVIERTPRTPDGPWLPAALTASIAQSAAEILDYEGIAQFPDRDTPTPLPPALVPPPPAPSNPTLVMPIPADPRTAPPVGPYERTVVGRPPEQAGRRGGFAAFLLAAVATAVIAALATTLVLAVRNQHSTPPVSTPATGTPSPTPAPSTPPTTPSAATSTPTQTPTTPATTPSATPTPKPTPTPTPTPTPKPTPTPTPSASTPVATPSQTPTHGPTTGGPTPPPTTTSTGL